MNSILLVDDERWVRTALRHTIEKLNKPFEIVQECSNGLEALDWLQENRVDLVLSDIRMPVMDGLAFIRELRHQQEKQDVILITVHEDFQSVQQALRSGVFDYLVKPVDSAELDTCLDKWLRLCRSRQEPDTQRAADPGTLSTVQQVLRYIAKTAPGDVTLADAAKCVHMNPSYLSQLFKQEMHINFIDYVSSLRIKEAKLLLTSTTLRISEIACRLGYSDIAYFSNMFRKLTGVSPSEYRKNAEKNIQ
jgi:YesN/AraC family two-component response regulator